MSTAKPRKSRLESWKEVAAFFGRTERTVMRWELERGLPIHRLPGDQRSRISAEVDELEAWLKGAGDPEPAPEPEPLHPAAPVSKRRWLPLIAAGAGAAAMFAALGAWWAFGNRPAPHVPPVQAQALYLKGMEDWTARTPASLTRSVDEFNAAIAVDPDYAQAYAGLANTYNLLSEYTAMPPAQAFPLARRAAEHAIKLDDHLAGAHSALAFALFYGSWDSKHANAEYEHALRLEPGNANIHHWYATSLFTQTDFKGAMTHIDRALELDPSSISIQADRADMQYQTGDRSEAVATLKQLEAAHPDFRSPHTYLSYIYLTERQDEDYLREALITAQLAKDLYSETAIQAGRAGLKSGGHEGMLRAMLAVREDQFSHGSGSAYTVAILAAHAGDMDAALRYLRLAFDRNDPAIIYLRLEPDFAPLHHLKPYQEMVARLTA